MALRPALIPLGARALVLASIALLSGCAGAGRAARGNAGAPQAALIPSVPFFSDDGDQCGPSTLAALLTYWGRPATPASLRGDIYLPKLKGTLPLDMVSAAAARGLAADSRTGTLDDIRAEIRARRPVIALLNRGLSWYPVDHYVLVVGFDDAREALIAHDGRRARAVLPYHTFLKQWEKTDRWMMTASSTTARAPVSAAAATR